MASPASAISDLPVYALPVSAQTCERLRFLGYATVGRVHALPLDQLVRQFGEEGHAVFQACRGGHVDLVNPTFPERSAAVSFTPEGGVADLESLGACLRVLADRLGEMLVAQDRFGKILEVRLELEDASIEKRKRTFVKPIEGVRAALFGLRTLLENPPEQPIVRFQARMHELEKARRIQRDLNGLTDRKERDRSAASAFLNLRKVLGDDCVQLGSEREEPRRVKVLRAWRDATGWR
jgi:nucleotidyltransferase/DNA polymerase involved in DNA repair